MWNVWYKGWAQSTISKYNSHWVMKTKESTNSNKFESSKKEWMKEQQNAKAFNNKNSFHVVIKFVLFMILRYMSCEQWVWMSRIFDGGKLPPFVFLWTPADWNVQSPEIQFNLQWKRCESVEKSIINSHSSFWTTWPRHKWEKYPKTFMNQNNVELIRLCNGLFYCLFDCLDFEVCLICTEYAFPHSA